MTLNLENTVEGSGESKGHQVWLGNPKVTLNLSGGAYSWQEERK